jgi:hypothetical protein
MSDQQAPPKSQVPQQGPTATDMAHRAVDAVSEKAEQAKEATIQGAGRAKDTV